MVIIVTPEPAGEEWISITDPQTPFGITGLLKARWQNNSCYDDYCQEEQ
jgi:hypothetical protein